MSSTHAAAAVSPLSPGRPDLAEDAVPVVAPAAATISFIVAPKAFGAFLGQQSTGRGARRARRFTVAASLVAHGVVAAVVVLWSFWRVEEIRPPRLSVNLVMLPAAAPPPPPPRATVAAPTPRTTRVPARSVPVAAPTQPVPPAQEAPEPEAAAQEVAGAASGETEGVEGGSEGGVVGAVSVTAPAPPPTPVVRPGPSEAQRRALLDRYIASLNPRLRAHQHYPPEAERLALEGRVLLRVSLDAGGRLVAVALAAACPHEVLCEAARRVVRDAAPLPAPPPELGGAVVFTLPVSYRVE